MDQALKSRALHMIDHALNASKIETLLHDIAEQAHRRINSRKDMGVELSVEALRARVFGARDKAIIQAEKWFGDVRTKVVDELAPGIGPAYQVRGTDDGWVILENGQTEPVQIFSRKPDAMKAARKLAREERATLDIFTKQGSLKESLSFS